MGNEEIRNQRQQKFFTDLTRVNCTESITGNINDLSEKISLSLSLFNTNDDYEYKIQIFSIMNNSPPSPLCDPLIAFQDKSGTCIVQKTILIQYYFEKEQPLLFEISKSSKGEFPTKYQVNTSLGCIMGSRKNTLQKQISQETNETLVVSAGKIQNNNDDLLYLKFDLKSNCPVIWHEIKNKIVFTITSSSGGPVYKSECINDNGIFSPVKIPTLLINNNFNIEFFDCKKRNVCKLTTNIMELTTGKSFNIEMSKRRIFTCTSKSYLTKNYTFIDYLKAGIQIGLSIAIDFTGSNGLAKEKSSLHYIYGQEPNQYERAILSCGNIVAYYDYDQLFPCYGFGANINGVPTPIFNLNFQPDPNIHLISNVIEAYHNALNVVRLWGPTQFGPIIRSFNNIIKQENDKLKYNILLILTDGQIEDVDQTIEELVDGSFLPLSVIIIGVGKADFSSMNILDADENPLVNQRGVKAARDLVQFVPFLKFESNPERLASEVLAEIPKQIVQYYEQNNLDPSKLMS